MFGAITRVQSTAPIFRVSLLPTWANLTLSDAFKAAFFKLPAVYNSAVYEAFILSFGTHVLTSAYFGGAGQQTVVVSSNW